MSKPSATNCWAAAHAGRLVPVGQRQEHRAALGQPVAGRQLALDEGQADGEVDAHDLARRAHLGPEHGVGLGEAAERQHRLLDGDVVAHHRGTSRPSSRSSASVEPAITRAATLASGTPVALATNGTVRDARGLASMTNTWFALTAYCTLIRPADVELVGDAPRVVLDHRRWSRRTGAAGAARRRCRPSARPPPRRAP